MSEEMLPAPLVAAEVNLQDFAFMPLDVARLRDSDLASDETPESCWAAVLLWCASWHQVPAASIPNNEAWLAKQCGYASRGRIDATWKKIRPGAMRGWLLCSDDRFYHPVVAEKALEAWKSKLEQRYRTEKARVAKHNQRHGLSLPVPDFDMWLSLGCPQGHMLPVPQDTPPVSSGSPQEIVSKRQGEGQGQGDLVNQTNPIGLVVASTSAGNQADLLAAVAESQNQAEPPESALPAGIVVPPCPHQEIIALYAAALPTMPQPRVWEGTRETNLRCRWRWVMTEKRKSGERAGMRIAETREQGLDWFKKYFAFVAESDFLTGRDGKWSSCDLEWLTKGNNFAKVLEGKYANKQEAAA